MFERPEIGELVWARVLEVMPSGAILQLEGEQQAFLPSSESQGEEGALAVGAEVVVKVIGYDRTGRPVVSMRRVSEADREEAQFHREAMEFRAALSARAVPVPEEKSTEERIEWRLARWIAHAEGVLRRRRSRPSPEFLEVRE